MTYKKKLIEVALPLEAINSEGRRDKSLNRRHPKSLHWWWSRKPLAVCRAIIFGQLVDDPSSHPDRFPTDEAQAAERRRLFQLLGQLVAWENSDDDRIRDAALAEIRRSMGDELPTVIDPFCGGGSIPVEVRRLGLSAIAADLNPVAAMITKAMIEIPAEFEDHPPVHPIDDDTLTMTAAWSGAAGLASDVEFYGNRLIEIAREHVGPLYESQREAEVGEHALAWLWARTVQCPNPGCGGVIPMANSFTLKVAKRLRSGTQPAVWAKPYRSEDGTSVGFRIEHGGNQEPGTVGGNSVRCLICGNSTSVDYVREQGRAGRIGRQLIAVFVTDGSNRYFRGSEVPPTMGSEPYDVLLTEEVPFHPQYLQLPRYGQTTFDSLYTPRQIELMRSLLVGLPSVVEEVRARGATEGYARAIKVYLAFLIDRIANRNSAQTFWNPNGQKVEAATANNYMPIRWSYAEANPFADASGSARGQLEFLVGAIESLPSGPPGAADQLDAMEIDWPKNSVFSTDPPYYASIPYADLSDFYYVILKRALRDDFPDIFSTVLTPKSAELVADVTRHGGDEGAARFFRKGFQKALGRMMAASHPDVPLVLYYGLRQQEVKDTSGWEQMLEGLVGAGLQITATWPVNTEKGGGLRTYRRNALASSIVITTRKRDENAPIATRREYRDQLRIELPAAVRLLQTENILPVDVAQSAIGPGMAVFSRFSKVVEADGSTMSVRQALTLINEVLQEVLSEEETEFDADTRWALTWYEENGFDSGPYGRAETLSKAKDTSVAGVVEAGVAVSRDGKVTLRGPSDLSPDWDPTSDQRATVWELTHHLIRRLESTETDAADLLRKVGAGYGDRARQLAYLLFDIAERNGRAKEAAAYNGLIQVWPDLTRQATASAGPFQQTLVE